MFEDIKVVHPQRVMLDVINHVKQVFGPQEYPVATLGGSRNMYHRLRSRGIPKSGWAKKVDEHFNKNDKHIDHDYNMDIKHAWALNSLPNFVQYDHHSYMDDMTVVLFKHEVCDMQVVCRTNLAEYNRMWNRIDPVFFFKHMWKSNHWVDALYRRSTGRNVIHQEDVRDIMNQLFRLGQVSPENILNVTKELRF